MFRCNPLVLISDVLGNCVQAKAGAATFVCPSPLAFTVLTQLSCLANLPQGEIISMYDGQENTLVAILERVCRKRFKHRPLNKVEDDTAFHRFRGATKVVCCLFWLGEMGSKVTCHCDIQISYLPLGFGQVVLFTSCHVEAFSSGLCWTAAKCFRVWRVF